MYTLNINYEEYMIAKYITKWYTCRVTSKKVDYFSIVSHVNYPASFAYNKYTLKWIIFFISINSNDSKYSKLSPELNNLHIL